MAGPQKLRGAEVALPKIDDKALIRYAKRSDGRFAVIGIAVLLISMIVLLSLIIDFMVDGLARIDYAFFTNYPSRRPEQAGILSAWVGSTLVMVTTGFLAVPLGVAAGVYLEEYAGKNLLSDIIEINVMNLAGVPSIIYGLLALGLFVQTFRLGQTILVAGMTMAPVRIPGRAAGNRYIQIVCHLSAPSP